jgi:hypothetical protein
MEPDSRFLQLLHHCTAPEQPTVQRLTGTKPPDSLVIAPEEVICLEPDPSLFFKYFTIDCTPPEMKPTAPDSLKVKSRLF